ncbi:MAG: hypothetical protein HYU68_07355 [Bacteroidetes bacterium]|nr:hypothetical protein [Bacteroidota bacterium]
MKKIIITLLAITTFSVAFAQVKYNTGNVEFDTDLGIVNANAKLDLKTFKINVSTTHNLPIPKVEELLQIMEPAEIILAADIAQVAQKPIDAVVTSYKKNKDKGWGVIAKEMGIKPGSPEFHALKGKTKTRKDKGKSEDKGKGNGNSKGKGNGKKK